MDKTAAITEALAQDGMSLEDFDPTVFVVVGGMVVEDSANPELAEEIIARAQSYGESAWAYVWEG